MTVLHQYSRLEAAGLWRSAPNAQAREVIVGLRKATIVLLDPKSEMPLTQWSLPAITRLSQGQDRVLFAPHPDGYETLELDDTAMIAALDKVRAVLDLRRKRPGRLRTAALGASLVLTLGAGAVWVPLKLFDFTAQRLPDAVRRDIGDMVLRDIATISGSPCARPSGLAAAQELARRLTPPPQPSGQIAGAAQAAVPPPNMMPLDLTPPMIMVVREGITAPTPLPGGTILLPYALVEQLDDPDTLAGLVLTARQQAARVDPMQSALRYAGIAATFRLLSSGALPQNALQGYGLQLAQTQAPPLDTQALAFAFGQLQITSRPYANFLDDKTFAAQPDTAPQGSTPMVLDDAAFLALQYICDP